MSVADVRAARSVLAGHVIHTPTTRSRTLSSITEADVWVKFENLQFTGSFKDRGALNKIASLDAEARRRGVIAMSAGNHAQGVANHAQRLSIPATIVMPTTAPLTKVAGTAALGARVVQHGTTFSEAAAHADALARAEDLVAIHPYDDPLIIAGQGTVGLEIFDDVDDVDVVIAPVGGGGLLSGLALAAESEAPACELVGVQTSLYPSMVAALHGAGPPPEGGTSIADGIAVKHPGEVTAAILRRLGVEVLAVGEARIEEAVGLFLEVEKTVAEGAGAAGLAALLDDPARFAGRRVVIVLSGGNIDLRLLSSVILRSLVRQGRLTRLRVEADDLPGSLGAVATTIGRQGANLLEVVHQRLDGAVAARRVDLDLLLETVDGEHLQRVVAALEAEDHHPQILDS